MFEFTDQSIGGQGPAGVPVAAQTVQIGGW
jgi:hypothetical protein